MSASSAPTYPWYQSACADLAPARVQFSAVDKDTPNAIAFAVLAKASLLWNNGAVITYAFISGTPSQQNKVNTVIADWGHYTNVTFSRVDIASTPLPNVRITFDATAGNWSTVGTLANSVQDVTLATMNLAGVQDTPDTQLSERGIILHEFGHVLGLTHEHPKSISLDPTATTSFYEYNQGWSASDVKKNILDVYSKHTLSNYMKPDNVSIMRNFMPKEMNLEQLDVQPSAYLSDMDKALMVVNYPPNQLDSVAKQWTLSHALDVLGVPKLDKHAMLLARPVDLRNQFALWFAQEAMKRGGASESSSPGSIPIPGRGVDSNADKLRDDGWCCSEQPEFLASAREQKQSGASRALGPARGVSVRESILWEPGYTIKYYLQQSEYRTDKLEESRESRLKWLVYCMNEWAGYSGIQFARTDNSQESDIRIFFHEEINYPHPRPNSWSAIGTNCRTWINNPDRYSGEVFTTLYLKLDEGLLEADHPHFEWNVGTIRHELGHTLGLRHEQASPLSQTSFVEPSDGGVVTAGDEVGIWTDWDPQSVMLYKNLALRGTMGQKTKENNEISVKDGHFVRALYAPNEGVLSASATALGLSQGAVATIINRARVAMSPGSSSKPTWSTAIVAARNELQWQLQLQYGPGGLQPTVSHGLEGPGSGEGVSQEVTSDLGTEWCGSQTPKMIESMSTETSNAARAIGPSRGVAVRSQTLWSPGETIKYFFQQPEYRIAHDYPGLKPEEFRQWRLYWIRSCMDEWQAASGLKLEEVFTEAEASVKIFFHEPYSEQYNQPFVQVKHSWCVFGTKSKTYRNSFFDQGGNYTTTMYLIQQYPGNLDMLDPYVRYTVAAWLHELGHLLGLRHEQASPLAPGNVVSAPETGLHTSDLIGSFTSFDPDSIMLYPNLWIGQTASKTAYKFNISSMDKTLVKALYAQDQPTLEDAVKALGLSGAALAAVIDLVPFLPRSQAEWNTAMQNARGELGQQLWILHGRRGPPPARAIQNGPSSGAAPVPGRGITNGESGEEVMSRTDWCGSESVEAIEEMRDADRGAARALGPSRGVIASRDILWNPGEIIKYYLQQPEYRLTHDTNGRVKPVPERARRIAILQECMTEWEACSGVWFVEVFQESDADVKVWFHEKYTPVPDYVQTYTEAKVSWSVFGTKCRKADYVNNYLSRGGNSKTTLLLRQHYEGDYSLSDPNLLYIKADWRHELGHLLGLRHEQMHPQSNLVVMPEVVADATEVIGGYTNYDPASIMLYRGIQIQGTMLYTSYNTELSHTDKIFVRALYAQDVGTLETASRALGLSNAAVTLVTNHDHVAAVAAFDTDGWIAAMGPARKELAQQLWINAGRPLGISPARGINPVPSSGANPLPLPGRAADPNAGGQYAWDTGSAGIYGQFIKPVVVNESEFRLTDQLYDVAEVVSGPNGVSMSQVYETVLNNLIPVFRSNGLAQQQDQIRQWLLRDVKTTAWIREIIDGQHTAGKISSSDDSENDGTVVAASGATVGPAFAVSNKLEDGTITRMELSNALMQEYLQAKQAWEVERDAMIEEALQLKLGSGESSAALNALTRKLAHTTAAREAQLSAKYADAVVRGYTHNVREYIGYLDIRTPAEALQDAKDSLREAAMSSMDGSLKVYPVQMTPIDWFEGLSTSFTMEDLTQDPELIVQQIRAKSTQLDVLNSQLTALRFGSQGDPEEMRDAVASAQARLDSAQSNLALKYSSNVIAMVKTCYTSDGALDEGQVAQLDEKGDLVGVVLDTLISDMQATSSAQNSLTSASRAYSQALAGYALAQATDTRQQQEQIQIQISGITEEVNELTARYTSLNRVNSRPAAKDLDAASQVPLADVPTFPVANDTSGGSRWQEIEINHEVESNTSSSDSSASASASSMHVNLWLASASTSSSESQAKSKSEARTYKNNVTIGFRATLVTVDRGGWFQPQFFKQSGSFYHVDPSISWSKWPAGVKNVTELKEQPQRVFDALNANSLLPSFPVGYILCKDITIKISESASATDTAKSNARKEASASGGILCFSYSSSSSSSSNSDSYSFQSCSDGFVVRIPGPQILGYIMQMTDNDATTNMPAKLPSDFFIPDADYDAATAGIGPANGLGPARALGAPPVATTSPFLEEIDSVLKKANVSPETMKGVRAAMEKEFSKLSKETADLIRSEA
ncbi:hypothetical protein EIP91_000938 [Steccherinum ochraceum]|uniref:Peptidase metallopeptidase domain-containing protein n=1 Tax=Steccherinum ochraceum TaxID=92696 RepID=A0A4R0RI64_9APHY|nr:hypothetical protein EIP91_000938 [Steccherinum ochraceum]